MIDQGEMQLDEAAFVRLLSRNAKPLYAYIASLVINVADTDEVFQETCCVLWTKFASFDADRSFLAWARGIAHLEVCAFRRRSGRRPALAEDVFAGIATAAAVEPSDQEERQQALVGCLEELSSRDSTLVRMRYYEQMSAKDIAQQTNASIHKIYRSLARVHDGLLRCIEHKTAGGRTP